MSGRTLPVGALHFLMPWTCGRMGGTNNSDGAGGGGSGPYADTSQQLNAARMELLHSRQAKLDAIKDRHDDLVCFHSPSSRTTP